MKKQWLGLALGAFLVISMATACRHQMDPATAPEVSFSKDIQPLIGSNCTMSGCHGTDNTSEFTLLTYDDVMRHVRSEKPRDSELYEMITEDEDDRMPPPPKPPLSGANIQKVYTWILQGAKNN